jgi:hypothetical protein
VKDSDIPDPNFYPSRPIPDTGSNNSTKRGGKIFFCPTIFCSHKYHKIVNNFIFEQAKKIDLAKALKVLVLFAQKFVTKLSKLWVWDPEKTYSEPRIKKAPDPDP